MNYRFEAATPEGFVQQLALYIANGYWFYVIGRIPDRKDPRGVDAKLLSRYEINRSKWARARRKRAGLANLQYLRYGPFFVVVATRGEHRFFLDEPFRDVRRDAIRFLGYSIGYGKGVDGRGHASVRIHMNEYRRLKRSFLELATQHSIESLTAEFKHLRYSPFARVRRQLLCILRAVNCLRKVAGLEPVPISALRLRRRVVRPFAQCELRRASA
jgi:hypothetical protein